jgi:flagellar biosynthetic protein FlhB
MAEQPGQEKTEVATPRRREKAWEQGQVAKSQELSSFMILLTGILVMTFLMPRLGQGIGDLIRSSIAAAFSVKIEPGTIPQLGVHWVSIGLRLLLPLFAILLVVGLGVNLAQVGIKLNPKLLAPKPERINPLSGFKRIFSKRSAFEMFKGLFKLGLLLIITWITLKAEQGQILGLAQLEVGSGLKVLSLIIGKLAGRLIILMVILALADFAFQRWQYEREIMMTRQELKDEFKETEGDPLLKSRLKALQREMASQRMMDEVKNADVVVTNPTHFAVALKYEDGKGAPELLAKGKNEIARRIKEIAREYGIPVMEDPPLARALYAEVKVGAIIPIKFFQAVAEMLAYVYRLRENKQDWS